MQPCMCFLVYQKFLLAKTSITLVTFIHTNDLFSRCYFIWTSFVRLLAGKGLSCMYFLMQQKKFLLIETLAALVAFETVHYLCVVLLCWRSLEAFSSLCVRLCRLRVPTREKHFPHWPRLKGFSPMCVLSCTVTLLGLITLFIIQVALISLHTWVPFLFLEGLSQSKRLVTLLSSRISFSAW